VFAATPEPAEPAHRGEPADLDSQTLTELDRELDSAHR
jgi:hypothetical protein